MPTPPAPMPEAPCAIAPDRRAAFLAALACTGRTASAAAEAGLHPAAVEYLSQHDPTFHAACLQAIDHAVAALEHEARRRAIDGVESLVVSGGEVVHHQGEPVRIRRYSDALLLALLKAHRPETYAPKARHSAGAGASPPPAVPAHIDRPPPETREAWLERRNRELEIRPAPAPLVPPARSPG